MSKINNPIPKQSFEFIRDRMAEILIDEIANQRKIAYNDDLKLTVYIERGVPFASSNLPAINIGLAPSSWDNTIQGNVQGQYVFNIDCVAQAKTTEEDRGDQSAAFKTQQIAGIVRYIFQDPVYKTLGFSTKEDPFIGRVAVSSILMGLPSNKGENDANSISIARVVVTVNARETNILKLPTIAAGYDTTVKVNNTEQGFKYTIDN